MKIGPKDPDEIKTVIFDFTNQLGTASISSAPVTVDVVRGADATPDNLKSGSPVISGALVRQLITGGLLGVSYAIHCIATDSSGQKHKVTAELDIARV